MKVKSRNILLGFLGLQILLGGQTGFAQTITGPMRGTIVLENGDRVESTTTGLDSTSVGGNIQINGAATIQVTSTGQGTGAKIANGTENSFGNGTQINVTGGSGTSKGIEFFGKGSVVAEKLAIHISSTGTGGSATGIDSAYGNAVDLGSGSTVQLTGNGYLTGIRFVSAEGLLDADGLIIKLNSTSGTSNGYGINAVGSPDASKGSSIHLGTGSVVETTSSSNLQGIYLNMKSSLTANQLTVNSKNHALNIQNGSTADLGRGSIITGDHSANGTVYVVGTGATLTAVEATFIQKGTASNVLKAQDGAIIQIGEGSKVISEKNGGMVAFNGTIYFKGSEEKRNTIQSASNYAVLAQQSLGVVEMENVDITTSSSYGLWAVTGGTIRMKDSTLLQSGGNTKYGLVASQGSKIELAGDLSLISKTGILAVVDGVSSKLSGSAQLNMEGTIYSQAGGDIDLKMLEGSLWKGGAVKKGDSQISLEMTGSTWEMTEDSNVSNLRFTGVPSQVMFAGTEFQTLNIENLRGDGGGFLMKTDLVGDSAGMNNGDFLEVTGTSEGTHLVTVANNGSTRANGTERLTLIRTADGAARFVGNNTVDLGGYEFKLRDVAGTDQKEWELYGTKKGSDTGSAGINLFSGSYLINYAETQTLLRRMGDLRDDSSRGGVWGRIYGGKFHSGSDRFLKDFDLHYTGVQAGADKKFIRKDGKGIDYLGGFFGYTNGSLDYGRGSGELESKSIGAYWTHHHHSGFYADAVLKYSWMKNDFEVLDTQETKVTGEDIQTGGLSASLEVGRRYHLDRQKKEGWYIEPQAQLTVSRQSGDEFTASNGLRFKVDSFNSVLGRLGMSAGYEVKGGKNPLNVYGKFSVVREFDGDVGYSFNGSKETTSYKDTWLVYGIGATAKLGSRHSLHLDVERATGGQFTQSWAVSGGYRYSW